MYRPSLPVYTAIICILGSDYYFPGKEMEDEPAIREVLTEYMKMQNYLKEHHPDTATIMLTAPDDEKSTASP